MANQTKFQSSSQPKTQAGTMDYNSGATKDSSAKNGSGYESSEKKSLSQLFEEGLKGIYNAERQLVKALPEMAKAAHNEELQDAFADHLEETKKHAERLEKIFLRLRIDKQEEKCKAMEGLIEEGRKIISEYQESPVRDSALIIAAQKIEHHEIAAYGSLCELADVLGYYKIADLLDRTLEEEESTDHLLSDIACDVNDEAYETQEKEEEDAVEAEE